MTNFLFPKLSNVSSINPKSVVSVFDKTTIHFWVKLKTSNDKRPSREGCTSASLTTDS